MMEIVLGTVLFTLILLGLVGVIMLAKTRLVASGDVTIVVNDQKELQVPTGGKLLNCLADQGIFVSSACGGGGTCAQCKVRVLQGGGDILPVERTYINKREAREGQRLSCQVAVKQPMKIEVPPEVFETKKWTCRVRSNRNVSVFIKELILELPEGESVDFKAGGYITIDIPPHRLSYREFDIDERFVPMWDKRNIWQYESVVEEPIVRAYSMANHPGEKGIIMLNVRVAFPPADAPPDAPPGKASSWLFKLKKGDEVTISGPYGEFYIHDSDSEMIYIGRGAGMAPLRSHIYDLLKNRKTQRKIAYWYNARNLSEVFYREDFEQLAREHPNFTYHLALSRPQPDDNWTGFTGYIAYVLHDNYLKDHPAPEDVEYYICGPPVMTDSVLQVLDDLGVEPDNIFFDDFGE